MLFKARRFPLLLFAILLGLGGSAAAQYPLPLNRDQPTTGPAQIREIVANYCRLDYEGARLDAQGWTKLEPVLWSKPGSDYMQMDVVARYTVDEPVEDHGHYSVTVHYLMLGRYDLATGYSRELARSTLDVEFGVSSNNGEWKIGHIDPDYPHVSGPTLVKWLNAKLAKEQDQASRQHMTDALKKLQPPPAAPPAQ